MWGATPQDTLASERALLKQVRTRQNSEASVDMCELPPIDSKTGKTVKINLSHNGDGSGDETGLKLIPIPANTRTAQRSESATFATLAQSHSKSREALSPTKGADLGHQGMLEEV